MIPCGSDFDSGKLVTKAATVDDTRIYRLMDELVYNTTQHTTI